jgi:hypothetical protein
MKVIFLDNQENYQTLCLWVESVVKLILMVQNILVDIKPY